MSNPNAELAPIAYRNDALIIPSGPSAASVTAIGSRYYEGVFTNDENLGSALCAITLTQVRYQDLGLVHTSGQLRITVTTSAGGDFEFDLSLNAGTPGFGTFDPSFIDWQKVPNPYNLGFQTYAIARADTEIYLLRLSGTAISASVIRMSGTQDAALLMNADPIQIDMWVPIP